MSQEPKPLYNIGDVVCLNAGGPEMSIKNLKVHHSTEEFLGTYRCQWFAGKKLDSGEFPEESLILIRKQGEPLDASA